MKTYLQNNWITLFFCGIFIVTATASRLPAAELVYESYVNDNWEIFRSAEPGVPGINLTNTSDRNELYPQVSPDGKRICFVEESGEGREAIRAVWLMEIDGSNRIKVAEYARQPCWSPDGKTIAYLPQEFPKFNVVDYFTTGLNFYNVETGQTTPHSNAANLHHLYNPCFAANGKWIAATVHAGMGYSHANLLIEVDGPRIIDLGIHGCRPCLSPSGKHIAWGESDYDIIVAELDITAETPAIGNRLLNIHDSQNKIYHVDFAPDGQSVSFSRGPDGKGDLTKPGTHQAACEMVGIYASGWDIFQVPLDAAPTVDFDGETGSKAIRWTTTGESNKESDWIAP
jgi:dipeptidyl aminopeptidase/acylaminoacyl peptidase